MKILTVYNTCGIRGENTEWYAECIKSILVQENIDNKVVISSCLNSDQCVSQLQDVFSNAVDIYRYKDPHTVNITFNRSVQEAVKKYGEFDGYLFIDSGILKDFGIVSFQTDTDTGYEVIGLKQDSPTVQITCDDFVLPLGTAVNAHAQIFNNDIYKRFGKVVPDVFAAYCTGSAYPFVSLSVNKRWVIVKDILLKHKKAVDGPSSGQSHISLTYRNHWNNLLYKRNALDFINDPEAIDAGMGYEECNKIMSHKDTAYENGLAKDNERLAQSVNKYFFLNSGELDYNKISVEDAIH